MRSNYGFVEESRPRLVHPPTGDAARARTLIRGQPRWPAAPGLGLQPPYSRAVLRTKARAPAQGLLALGQELARGEAWEKVAWLALALGAVVLVVISFWS